MKVVSNAIDLKSQVRNVCLAIGFFDGVHLGHQEILKRTLADARQQDAAALAITFDRHPTSVVAPHRVPPLIYSLPQKIRAIESLGIDWLLLLRFDEAFSRQTGEEFIRNLARDLGRIRTICVGANFGFGQHRSGNVGLLQQLGGKMGFSVHGMDAVTLDGKPVSSTRVREAIQSGRIDDAGKLLGRPYSISGTVIRGDKVGRQLGFPTANLDVSGLALPPKGVYVADALFDGRVLPAVLNIGIRPTLRDGDTTVRVEVHLLDYEGDLYDKELEVVFKRKLRSEQKFGSIPELRAQITRDIAAARAR